MSRGRELHGANHLGSDSTVEQPVKRPTPKTVAGHVVTEPPLASYQIFSSRNAGAPHQYQAASARSQIAQPAEDVGTNEMIGFPQR